MTRKIRIRRIMSALLSFSGIHALLERVYLSDSAFVLMYHRVLSSAGQVPYHVQSGMFVTAATFEKQISYLRDRFEIIFLDELVAKVKNEERIGRYCALTFDDGWGDNYSEAFPLIKKYNIPVTIFLPTGFVGTQRMFWPEEISPSLACLYDGSLTAFQAPPSFARFVGEIVGLKRRDLETFIEGSIEVLKMKSPQDREEILSHFRGCTGSESPPRQILNWEESREMVQSGLVRFGAHTVNHELLDQLPLQMARNEINLSCREIEQHLKQKVTTFAYPNGNHNKAVRQLLVESGLDAAVTTRKGFLEHGVSSLEIPRVGLHEDVSSTIPMLRSKILLQAF